MKITLYELLGLIKDGIAPKTFKYDSFVWTYNNESFAYWNGNGVKFEYYMDDGFMKYLNDEVEMIEENPSLNDIREKYGLPRIKNKKIEPQEHKIPKKLSAICACSEFNENEEKLAKNINILKNKINEIIDYLEKIE